jgi:quinol monooxygenase YgiN
MPDTGSTIHLHGQLICGTAADAAIVAAHVPVHVALTLAEPGCLSFEVTPTDDPLI